MKALVAFFYLAASPLWAHPHIFVNTGIEAVMDAQNRLTHLRITWEYDELYSLLITEDLGVDDDYDGVLTQADLARLRGFDMKWIDGFNGDLVVTLEGDGLQLSGPMEPTATMADGKITTTHLRAVLPAPQVAAGDVVSIKPFDATYYTAYDVTLPIKVTGRDGCETTRNLPKIDAALQRTQDELAGLAPDVDTDQAGYAGIGERFATEIVMTCGAS